MLNLRTDKPLVGLTATEISSIWASYLKSSMEKRFFDYFLSTTEDANVIKVVEKMVTQSQKNLEETTAILTKENLTIPLGFTEDDVRVGENKVFSDTFILYLCHDLTMLSMSTYPSAISDCTRKDVRNHFQVNIEFSIMIQNELTDLMLTEGLYLKPPQIAIENGVDFVDSLKYLNGSVGDSRPLNTAEIANLTRIIHRAQFSKMVFVIFCKLATTKDIKKHFSKGRNELEKIIDSLQEIFEEENIPISASGAFKIFDVELSPFTDKIMLFFVNTCLGMFCFTMINQAMATSLRSDIQIKINKISKDMKKYYGHGLLLTINEKWLEQPPHAVDRKV
ncbi:DUF3231 family protein [Bacillus sp. 2205SS5-2]|uniref:DUF3231 family protein n=1 Tax=Bacillus sp. 2205SS5-2 TaxID=3109031 RepID=UPI003004AE09